MKKPKKFAAGGMTLQNLQNMLTPGKPLATQGTMNPMAGLGRTGAMPASVATNIQVKPQNDPLEEEFWNKHRQSMLNRVPAKGPFNPNTLAAGLSAIATKNAAAAPVSPKRNIFGVSQSRAAPLSIASAAPVMGGPGPSRTLGPVGAQPVQMMAKGGSVSASKRGDGCAQRGKTKGRMI